MSETRPELVKAAEAFMQSHGLVEVKRWINLGGALTIIADSPTLRVTMTIAD